MILRPASTAAATALALFNATFPAPYPPQAVLCYDRRYARDVPAMGDCMQVIEHGIVSGPNPGQPIAFSRAPLPGVHARVPKGWIAPGTTRHTCRVSIDVPMAPAEKASLVEIQATARVIQMKCVLGADHLGGMTLIGKTGNMLVEILGFPEHAAASEE
ncbi:MAG: hypothetical protein LQ346_007420 [Caloplaca aetnensis]|nr:MAG: hypothetical protein LQ346_007420 [Caloplaca aetnensis]